MVTQHSTRESSGALVDNADGTWTYTYATDPGDPATLPNMLRSCIQFALAASVENPCIDFVPEDLAALGQAATSLDNGFYAAYRSRQIVVEASCNTCHAQLAFHGSRTATDYCVTCHNPGFDRCQQREHGGFGRAGPPSPLWAQAAERH